jgi:hypothetical protein
MQSLIGKLTGNRRATHPRATPLAQQRADSGDDGQEVLDGPEVPVAAYWLAVVPERAARRCHRRHGLLLLPLQ